jgi:hypothetical protein
MGILLNPRCHTYDSHIGMWKQFDCTPVLLLVPVENHVVSIGSTPRTVGVWCVVFSCLCPVLGAE